jgi:hypothetical protein
MIRRWRFSVWLRSRCQPQPAPISSLSCTRWSAPQAGATALMPPLQVPERQGSGVSNSVHPSQTVNGGIKDGTDSTTHRPKSFHSSRSGPLYTDTLSVSRVHRDPRQSESPCCDHARGPSAQTSRPCAWSAPGQRCGRHRSRAPRRLLQRSDRSGRVGSRSHTTAPTNPAGDVNP